MTEFWTAIGLMASFLALRRLARSHKWSAFIPYLAVLGLGLLFALSSTVTLDRLRQYFTPPPDIAGFLSQVAMTVILGLGGAVLNVLLHKVFRLPSSEDNNPYERFLNAKPYQFCIFVTLYLPVMAALEELVFRVAFIGIGLSDDSTNVETICLVLMSSIIFGLDHLSKERPGQAIHAGIAGLIWGSAFTISGSIWVPLVAHTLHNMIMFTALYVRLQISPEVE